MNNPFSSVALDSAFTITDMNKWIGDFHVLKNINLNLGKTRKMVILGTSGSGKSTLLRCLNGLENFQEGKICVLNTKIDHNIPKTIQTIRQKVGMVFQQFHLFPHLTILENLTLAPIWVKKISKKQAIEQAYFYLERVHIAEQALKYPAQLSGGQQQRAAIARSLCMEPEIMLFDEPTSALDPTMVNEVLDTIADLAKHGMTMVCVTHEMNFARRLADEIVLMNDGQIIEHATTEDFFENPQHHLTKKFLKGERE